MKQRAGWTLLAMVMMVTLPAAAQLPPVGVPRGMVRVELGGEFRHADSRFQDGTTQDLTRSFTTAALGGSFFSPLRVSETSIGRLIGDLGYRLNAGSTLANGLVEIGTGFIGASYGLTGRITLFATVPIVQTRMQTRILYDSANADAGFNPGDPLFGSIPGRSQTAGFFTDFEAALNQLETNINTGVYDANPAQRTQAENTLDQGKLLRDELRVIFDNADAPFVPLATSSAGVGITDSIAGYQATLTSLSVGGFSSLPALASARLSPADLQNFITNPAGPVAAFPLEDVSRSRMGDIEGGIGYTLVDRWNRDHHPGGFRAVVEGRVRFPTGLIDRSDDLIDVGTGSGHLALGVAGTADLGTGRWGVRVRGSYEHSFARNVDRRVSSPLQPIAPASYLRTVKRQPGSLIDVAATPFFRLVSTFALLGGVRLRRHARDQVTYASPADSVPGVSAAVMSEGTDWTLTTFQAGVSYQSPATITPGKSGFPVEASWIIEGPLSSSRGIVAKERTMRFQLRLYARLFD